MKKDTAMQLDGLKDITPIIRSVLAFILKVRNPVFPVGDCYKVADSFLVKLKEDIKDNE